MHQFAGSTHSESGYYAIQIFKRIYRRRTNTARRDINLCTLIFRQQTALLINPHWKLLTMVALNRRTVTPR